MFSFNKESSPLRPIWKELLHIQHLTHYVSRDSPYVNPCFEIQQAVEWLAADGYELTRQGIEFLYILGVLYAFCITLGLFIHFEVPRRWRPSIWLLHVFSYMALFVGTFSGVAHLSRLIFHERVREKLESIGNSCLDKFWCKSLCLEFANQAPSTVYSIINHKDVIQGILISSAIALIGICIRIPRRIVYSSYNMPNLKSNCPICLESFRERKAIQIDCGHMFHYDCVYKWFESCDDSECPVCRMKITESYF